MAKAPWIALVGLVGCGDNVGGAADGPASDGRVADASTLDAGVDAPGTPTAVTFRVFSTDGVPAAGDVVLVADDGGPWRPMTSTESGVYTAEVIGPRYAIARGCRDPDAQYSEALLYYLTLAEATELADRGCRAQASQVEISGAVIGVAANQRGSVFTAGAVGGIGVAATSYTMTAPPGTTDLVALLHPAVPVTQPRPTQRLLIARDVDVSAPVVLDLDFATDGFDPVARAIDVTGAGIGAERVSVQLHGDGMFPFTIEDTRASTNVYHAPPADRMRPGERLAITRVTVVGDQGRLITRVVDAPVDLTEAYGPAYETAEPAIVAHSPSRRLSGSLPQVDGADVYLADAVWVDETTFDLVYWAQQYTAGYAAAAAVDYEFPDLAGIGGWDVGIGAGEIYWSHNVISSAMTARLPTVLDVEYVVGDTILIAASSGVLGP